MKDKKVIFMGTPEFSVPILESLISITNVVLVITKVDSEVGRKKVLTPSPIKEVALKNDIEVLTPVKISDAYDKILEINPDLIITAAYGKIVPESILSIPKLGCINVHASLLPKYRGASPIHACLMDGVDKTGVTIMYMDKGMDTGDIISSKEVMIEDSDNLDTLTNKLSLTGKELLIETLPSIFNGTNNRIKQNDEEATYTHILTREDEKINFNKKAINIHNLVRALSMSIGAYFIIDDSVIKVFDTRVSNRISKKPGVINEVTKDYISIGTSDYDIELLLIKPSGKNIMKVRDYLNGKNKEDLINKEV